MKKNIKILSILVVLCATITMVITAQNTPGENNIPQAQISEAINSFVQLANKDAQSFGLKNADELRNLKAGKQFQSYMIQLDDLKKYNTGNDVNAIIKELPSVEVALTDANNNFVTSVEFIKNDGKWKPSGFGASTEFKMLYNPRSPISDSIINTCKFIRIPALHTSFIAVTDASSKINFIATEDNESLGFKRGALIAADSALVKLVQAANLYNGLPD